MSEATNRLNLAEADPWSVPLDQIDVSEPALYQTDTHWGYFERLRRRPSTPTASRDPNVLDSSA